MSNSDSKTSACDSIHYQVLERLRPELEQITNKQLAQINVDPVDAVITIQSAIPKLKRLVAEAHSPVEGLSLGAIERLELLTQALLGTQASYGATPRKPVAAPEIVAELRYLKDILSSNAEVLSKHGYRLCAPLNKRRGTPSYAQLATDVLTLATAFHDHWATIGTKTCLTVDTISRAMELVQRALNWLAERRVTAPAVEATTLLRRQAFTLLFREYDQIRKAVTYLRWEHKDVEAFAPPLNRKRRSSRKRKGPVATAPAASAMPEAHPAVQPIAEQPTAEQLTTVAPVAVGLPGADPFLH